VLVFLERVPCKSGLVQNFGALGLVEKLAQHGSEQGEFYPASPPGGACLPAK
jgi:hypothetical protein